MRYIYLIREKLGELAPVKIGVARNVDKRLETLQTGNSRTLVVAAKIGPFSKVQAYSIEGQLHKKFKKHRIKGEWFTGVIFSKFHSVIEDIELIDEPENTR